MADTRYYGTAELSKAAQEKLEAKKNPKPKVAPRPEPKPVAPKVEAAKLPEKRDEKKD
ncbi:hypothetical protein Wildcat_106 [Mycobacterium phage Wildcat]|uniref:Uncharacterized protein n=4 Tax=Mycobacterium virus Wildcat TaxID=1993859 RepID=Q19XV8_9CAUD|nr:hypothetical protein Wildcat_106 [Mycobacterium phage Wildcat]AJD82173.1 hypothetical protein COSMO_104 [Mycobacterium phage Cosmo]AQT25771.1 hypothetical protein EniyanLRS_99 [Mycobacterium phage EniyanLRS]QGJ89989.1 hypothetical protein PBI_MARYV_105 [Mycobacterium phage MaryV]WKR36110.1 hypothetical protein [Mycobacterium phage Azrael100]ABE67707.1 hypothetical protein Wildcat_106 [Mycobacterium phage Wildcat]